VIAVMVGGATFAYFSDVEISSSNAFKTKYLDMKISDGNDDEGDGVSGDLNLSNMKPGDETPSILVAGLHKDEESIDIDHLEITTDYIIMDPPGPESDTQENTHPDDMAKEMIITQMNYYDSWKVDLLTDDGYDNGYGVSPGETGPKVDDVDGDGKISLYDLKYSQGGNGVDNLTVLNTTWLRMRIKFDEDADSRFQGDTLIASIIFTFNQDSSQ
jgi:predicted ribosomally synthesized peptide with SipW-like signal peptide